MFQMRYMLIIFSPFIFDFFATIRSFALGAWGLHRLSKVHSYLVARHVSLPLYIGGCGDRDALSSLRLGTQGSASWADWTGL